MQTEALVTDNNAKRSDHLSADGKWRSFPRVPNLLQYVSTGTYFARVKVNGKLFRQSLDTDVFSTAKLRLADFVKEKNALRIVSEQVLVAEALDLYRREVQNETGNKPQSKAYREWCIKRLLNSWPELPNRIVIEITSLECKEWALRLKQTISGTYYNNVLGTLRGLLDVGIKEHIRRGGGMIENPAIAVSRARNSKKELWLPEPSQFQALLDAILETCPKAGRQLVALVKFLSFSGVRIGEARWITWNDIDWHRKEIVVRGHPETATKNSDMRRVPMIPELEILLRELEAMNPDRQGTDFVVTVTRSDEMLEKACRKLGIQILTPHDFRHLFATRCIEAGVDIPTVSRWLGHKDGGVLAMKTYGHLRNEHSRLMAEKVRFSVN